MKFCEAVHAAHYWFILKLFLVQHIKKCQSELRAAALTKESILIYQSGGWGWGLADLKGEEPSRWGGELHFLAEMQIWDTMVGPSKLKEILVPCWQFLFLSSMCG